MLPDNHPTRKVSNTVKLNGKVLTENNVTSSKASKIAVQWKEKAKIQTLILVLHLKWMQMHNNRSY